MRTIYDLKLHETLYEEMKWGIRTDITRVASGWIYQSINRQQSGKDEYLNCVFVPFDNRFQITP